MIDHPDIKRARANAANRLRLESLYQRLRDVLPEISKIECPARRGIMYRRLLNAADPLTSELSMIEHQTSKETR